MTMISASFKLYRVPYHEKPMYLTDAEIKKVEARNIYTTGLTAEDMERILERSELIRKEECNGESV